VLLNTSGYTIGASVNEADVANVQLNQPVQFTLAAFPSQTFRATVTNISQLGTTTSGVVTYPITLTVDMNSIGNAHFYPGMTATANITTAQRIGAELVSNSAFTFPTTALQAGVISRSDLTGLAGGFGGRGSASGQSATGGTGTQSAGTRHIVLVQRNGKLVPVAITVGLTNGTSSEVLSGLNDGDLVVVSATGGPFANLSTTTGGTTGAGRGGLGGGGFGGGGFGGGGGRTGSGG
jgi:multidrug efflux pump subunit AcrA (membrane-fusion protein)